MTMRRPTHSQHGPGSRALGPTAVGFDSVSSPPNSVRDEGSRRRSRIAFGLIALATLLVLGLTTLAQLDASADRSWRLTWAVASMAVTALLLAVFVTEILRRIRAEGAVVVVDRALAPLNRSTGAEPDDRPIIEHLEDIASSAARATRALSATLLLDDRTETPMRVSSGPAALGPSRSARHVAQEGACDSDTRGARHTAALVCEGSRLGLLEVVTAPGQDFTTADRRVLQLLAPRIAVHVERARLADAERRSRLETEQARRQVNVLARASVPLAPGLDNPEETIRELADIVVPEFANLFAVDLARDGGALERIVMAFNDGTRSAALAELGLEHPNWQDTLRRVMAKGESELAFSIEAEEVPARDEPGTLMHDLGMQSWVVAPIRVRNESIGTMTLATSSTRRGYRPSDLVTIDDLVARSAIAFERGLLYREARQAASEALRSAHQLGRMVEATIVLTRTLAPAALLLALVEQAAFVLESPRAHVQLVGEDGFEAEFGPQLTVPVRLTSPLVSQFGHAIGHLTVERPQGARFAPGDDAVLTMLAEAASVARQNAQLYQDARHREQRLQALIEASPLAILEIDRAGTVLVANPAARALFPVTDAQSAELAHIPSALEDRLARLVADTARGERREVELITTDDAGERRDLWVSTAPVSGEGLDAVHILAVISDMTGRKRLEEQLATAQRFEAIATLAGGVAHDFNNLLTVILGYSEILLHGFAEGLPERESVEAIQEAGNHAAVITNQLLALSRHQVLQPETIDAVQRCAALVPMLRRIAGTSIEIGTKLTGSGRIRVDPGQLEQVLFNLVFNSRDAMPNGGHVLIEVGERTTSGGEAVVFVRVTDDGEGMDAETLARCQEPFFTTKSRSRGIGLGLATVASILERSGGTIEMTSKVGCGTTSTVSFPSVAATETSGDPGLDPERARVLLVDDDEQVRRFAARVLTQSGYQVTEVPDGESAIGQVEASGAFDLLITDVELPVMSGAAVVRTAQDRWPLMACLLITGYAEADSLDLEADTMLVPKPFAPEDLLRAAAEALRTARVAARLDT